MDTRCVSGKPIRLVAFAHDRLPEDHISWTQLNERVWRESRLSVRDNPRNLSVENGHSPGCLSCGQLTRQWRWFPSRLGDSPNRSSFPLQSPSRPFLGRPALYRGETICANFDDGNCQSPCRWFRSHRCSVCGATTHEKFNHPRGRPGGMGFGT